MYYTVLYNVTSKQISPKYIIIIIDWLSNIDTEKASSIIYKNSFSLSLKI